MYMYNRSHKAKREYFTTCFCVENDDDNDNDVDCVHVVRLLDFKPVTFQVSITLALV